MKSYKKKSKVLKRSFLIFLMVYVLSIAAVLGNYLYNKRQADRDEYTYINIENNRNSFTYANKKPAENNVLLNQEKEPTVEGGNAPENSATHQTDVPVEKPIAKASLSEKTEKTVQPDKDTQALHNKQLMKKRVKNSNGALQKIFTIQTGSYLNKVNAQNQFKSVINGLSGKTISNFRIEKIGNYYTIRLGTFEDRIAANEFLRSNKSKLPSAIVLEAYLKDKNIVE